MKEKILVRQPGCRQEILFIQVDPDDEDKDIALRLAKTLSVGTVMTIAGVKWLVEGQKPPQVRVCEVRPSGPGMSAKGPPEAVSEDEAVADTLPSGSLPKPTG